MYLNFESTMIERRKVLIYKYLIQYILDDLKDKLTVHQRKKK